MNNVFRLLNATHSHSEDYFSGWNITNIETYASNELLVNPDTDKERTLLIGAIIGISVLLLVLVILTAHFWIRTGRYDSKAWFVWVDNKVQYNLLR